MSTAKPMRRLVRLDHYERQRGDGASLTPAQDRRDIHKTRHKNGTDAGIWLWDRRAKNRSTPRQIKRRPRRPEHAR